MCVCMWGSEDNLSFWCLLETGSLFATVYSRLGGCGTPRYFPVSTSDFAIQVHATELCF